MKWQRNLLDRPKLFVISQNEAMWASSSFYLTVIINILVAFFYPFDNSVSGERHCLEQ
jgi:inositol 1,4,5-triphosphate receptor type 1